MLKATVVLLALGAVLGFPKYHNPSPNGRIVGGHDADITEYPYHLALMLHNQAYCGAVLIRPRWGLTAAHCASHGEYDTFAVRAGSTYPLRGGQIVSIIKATIHPSYNDTHADYDFALLELAEPVTAEDAAPVDLALPNNPVEEGDVAVVTGWGAVGWGQNGSEILQVAEIPVVRFETCLQIYGSLLTKAMFCAGDLVNGGLDSCTGDSGGPVTIGGRLAGLVSWGNECALPDFPGVYANVAIATEWILEQIGESGMESNLLELI